MLGWIHAFLGDRSQRVVVEGEESGSVPVTSGVPQGLVLGPILFLIYINDLPVDISLQVRIFDDDTALCVIIEGVNDGQTLQKDLDKLALWEARWDMEFNPSKCQVVQVTGSKKPIQFNYRLHCHVLKTVTCAKYLGVDVSSGLTWNSHIDRATGNANKTLGFLKRNIKSKMPRIIETAYNTLMRPQVEYASAV